MKNKICGARFKSVFVEALSFFVTVILISTGDYFLIDFLFDVDHSNIPNFYEMILSVAIVWAFIEYVLRIGKGKSGNAGNALESDDEILARNARQMHDLLMILSSLVIFGALVFLGWYLSKVLLLFFHHLFTGFDLSVK